MAGDASYQRVAMAMTEKDEDWELGRKVYIGGLGEGADKQEIERICERFGAIRNVWVARHPPGFAFAIFNEPMSADVAVKYMDNMLINGRAVRVQKSTGKKRWEMFPVNSIERPSYPDPPRRHAPTYRRPTHSSSRRRSRRYRSRSTSSSTYSGTYSRSRSRSPGRKRTRRRSSSKRKSSTSKERLSRSKARRKGSSHNTSSVSVETQTDRFLLLYFLETPGSLNEKALQLARKRFNAKKTNKEIIPSMDLSEYEEEEEKASTKKVVRIQRKRPTSAKKTPDQRRGDIKKTAVNTRKGLTNARSATDKQTLDIGAMLDDNIIDGDIGSDISDGLGDVLKGFDEEGDGFDQGSDEELDLAQELVLNVPDKEDATVDKQVEEQSGQSESESDSEPASPAERETSESAASEDEEAAEKDDARNEEEEDEVGEEVDGDELGDELGGGEVVHSMNAKLAPTDPKTARPPVITTISPETGGPGGVVPEAGASTIQHDQPPPQTHDNSVKLGAGNGDATTWAIPAVEEHGTSGDDESSEDEATKLALAQKMAAKKVVREKIAAAAAAAARNRKHLAMTTVAPSAVLADEGNLKKLGNKIAGLAKPKITFRLRHKMPAPPAPSAPTASVTAPIIAQPVAEEPIETVRVAPPRAPTKVKKRVHAPVLAKDALNEMMSVQTQAAPATESVVATEKDVQVQDQSQRAETAASLKELHDADLNRQDASRPPVAVRPTPVGETVTLPDQRTDETPDKSEAGSKPAGQAGDVTAAAKPRKKKVIKVKKIVKRVVKRIVKKRPTGDGVTTATETTAKASPGPGTIKAEVVRNATALKKVQQTPTTAAQGSRPTSRVTPTPHPEAAKITGGSKIADVATTDARNQRQSVPIPRHVSTPGRPQVVKVGPEDSVAPSSPRQEPVLHGFVADLSRPTVTKAADDFAAAKASPVIVKASLVNVKASPVIVKTAPVIVKAAPVSVKASPVSVKAYVAPVDGSRPAEAKSGAVASANIIPEKAAVTPKAVGTTKKVVKRKKVAATAKGIKPSPGGAVHSPKLKTKPKPKPKPSSVASPQATAKTPAAKSLHTGGTATPKQPPVAVQPYSATPALPVEKIAAQEAEEQYIPHSYEAYMGAEAVGFGSAEGPPGPMPGQGYLSVIDAMTGENYPSPTAGFPTWDDSRWMVSYSSDEEAHAVGGMVGPTIWNSRPSSDAVGAYFQGMVKGNDDYVTAETNNNNNVQLKRPAGMSPNRRGPVTMTSPSRGGPVAMTSPTRPEPLAVGSPTMTSPTRREPVAVGSPTHREPPTMTSPIRREPTTMTSPIRLELPTMTSPTRHEPTAVTSPTHGESAALRSPSQREANVQMKATPKKKTKAAKEPQQGVAKKTTPGVKSPLPLSARKRKPVPSPSPTAKAVGGGSATAKKSRAAPTNSSPVRAELTNPLASDSPLIGKDHQTLPPIYTTAQADNGADRDNPIIASPGSRLALDKKKNKTVTDDDNPTISSEELGNHGEQDGVGHVTHGYDVAMGKTDVEELIVELGVSPPDGKATEREHSQVATAPMKVADPQEEATLDASIGSKPGRKSRGRKKTSEKSSLSRDGSLQSNASSDGKGSKSVVTTDEDASGKKKTGRKAGRKGLMTPEVRTVEPEPAGHQSTTDEDDEPTKVKRRSQKGQKRSRRSQKRTKGDLDTKDETDDESLERISSINHPQQSHSDTENTDRTRDDSQTGTKRLKSKRTQKRRSKNAVDHGSDSDSQDPDVGKPRGRSRKSTRRKRTNTKEEEIPDAVDEPDPSNQTPPRISRSRAKTMAAQDGDASELDADPTSGLPKRDGTPCEERPRSDSADRARDPVALTPSQGGGPNLRRSTRGVSATPECDRASDSSLDRSSSRNRLVVNYREDGDLPITDSDSDMPLKDLAAKEANTEDTAAKDSAKGVTKTALRSGGRSLLALSSMYGVEDRQDGGHAWS